MTNLPPVNEETVIFKSDRSHYCIPYSTQGTSRNQRLIKCSLYPVYSGLHTKFE